MPKCLYCQKKTKGRRIYCSDTHRVYYHRSIKQDDDKTANNEKLILSLCDYSGSWSKPYLDAGYRVERVDIDLDGRDVRLFEFQKEKAYGILAAPPCTVFASSGAVWWGRKGKKELLDGISIVDACLRIVAVHKPQFWVLENPVGRLRDYLGPARWIFNPCDYGDPYSKKTCLWGEFNVPRLNKVETIKIASGHHAIDHYYKSQGFKLGKDRQRLRSITPGGFAKAFFLANP